MFLNHVTTYKEISRMVSYASKTLRITGTGHLIIYPI